MIKKLMTFMIAFTIASCAHRPVDPKEIQGGVGQNLKNLDFSTSFAFYHGKDEYHFASILLKEGDLKCPFFVGFKNGELKYSFHSWRLVELSKIYYDKLTLEQKKTLALKKLDELEVEQQKCTRKNAQRDMTTHEMIESGLMLIFFAPIIPLAMMTFGAEDAIKRVQDEMFSSRADNIRLGMSMEEVQKLMKKELQKEKIKHYEYYSVNGNDLRIAMVFEKNRLTGFVRGQQGKSAQHPK